MSALRTAAPRLVRRALAITFLLICGVMLAGGAVPDAGGRIQACYSTSAVRLVNSSADCRGTERNVSWIQDAPPFPPIPPVRPDLLVITSGNGAGAVQSVPAGIDCGASCLADFPNSTLVTLLPHAAAGSTFAGWSGACTGAGACVVNLTGARSVAAKFVRPDWVTVNPTGAVGARIVSTPPGIDCPGDCMGYFPPGTEVRLDATPDESSALVIGWTGAHCIRMPVNSCTILTDGPTIVEPDVERIHTLDIANVAGGRVIASPSPQVCTGLACYYLDGTHVHLTAYANSNTVFTQWSRDCSGTTPTCDLVMDQDHEAQANFAVAWTLNAWVSGSGAITSSPAGISCPTDCSERIVVNTVVTLTATPSAGSRFVQWNGCTPTSTPNVCTVTMGYDHSVSAFFEAA